MSAVESTGPVTLPQIAEVLLTLQNPDGGWGYGPGMPSQPEPTALAMLALLRDDANRAAVERGGAWLRNQQDQSGAFRVPGAFAKSYWPTGLSIIALHHLQAKSDAVTKGLGWLLAERSKTKDMNEELARDFEIDVSLAGWGWTEGTFSWVDPTAWAILALRHTGHGQHPRAQEGLKLLLDRAYPEGGANCGNRRIYGSRTEPVPANTCSLLLAHAGLDDDPKLAASRAYVRAAIRAHADLENLCWIRLALHAWEGEGPTRDALPELEERIRDLYREQACEHRVFRRSTVRQALTILALDCHQYHPLQPADEPPHPINDHVKRTRPGLVDRLGSFLRGIKTAAVGQLRALPDSTVVHIARAANYDDDLVALVAAQYEKFRDRVPLKDKRVVVKPNLVEYHADRVINTNPKVVAAVLDLCRKEGAKDVTVAEGPGHWRNVEYLVTASGLRDVLEKYQVPFVDVNSDRIAQRLNLGMLTGMEYIYFSATIADADVLISMPKLKTHHWAGVTLSLKNLFGTLPGICYGWPKNELHHCGIENSIIDIALTRTPELAVVDGIIGMEGDGPLNGKAKPLGAIIMGSDPLAVDCTCARLMGFRPERIGHLQLGSVRRLGHLDATRIVQAGEPIDAVRQPFVPPPKLETIVNT